MSVNSSHIEAETQAYCEMRRKHFALADALLGGTEDMRAAGTEFLPKFNGETDGEYNWRLSNAFLKPILTRSADSMVGHVFREGLNTSELDLDENILNDFDLLGTSLDGYAAKVCTRLLTHGMAHTYTDFPPVGASSAGQEASGEVRPYAQFIEPIDLFFALPTITAGVEVPREVRWRAGGSVEDGWYEQTYKEIRRVYIANENTKPIKTADGIITPVIGDVVWEQWRSQTEAGYSLEQAGIFAGRVDYIPLRTAYADYRGFMASKPVLEAQAQANLAHWQKVSDHNCIVQMSRFPMFYATGVSADELDELDTVGPHIKLGSTNPDAKFGYAEPTGRALEMSFKDLERITREADERSIEALYKAGSDTATGRRIDFLEGMSPAQRAAKETERHINQVISDFGARLGRDLGRVSIDLDFGVSENEDKIIEALHKARTLGDLPRTYYLKRLQELGAIGDDVDVELLADEAGEEVSDLSAERDFGDASPDQVSEPENGGQ